MEKEQVFTEKKDRIGIIYLNNPPLNLQTLASTLQLEKIVMDLNNDDEVRVVILTGNKGRVFCAGSDIKEFPKLKTNFIEAKIRRENAVFNRIERMKKPTIAAIDGIALGGGSEVTLCCDFRVLDETAYMGFPEIFLGGFPGSGGVVRLPRLVGETQAKELMSLGSAISPQEALRIGLISRIAPAGRALETALEMAKAMAEKPADIIRAVKTGVMASPYLSSAEAIELSIKLFEGLLAGQKEHAD